MATRRSRIKAVANLPARRSRPAGSNEVKKEDLESPEANDFSTPRIADSSSAKQRHAIFEDGSQSGKEGSKESSTSENDSSQSVLKNSIGDGATSEESKSAPDRRSVIVSVDKDRKSVIVNRDDCISPTKVMPKLNSESTSRSLTTDLKKQTEDNVHEHQVPEDNVHEHQVPAQNVKLQDTDQSIGTNSLQNEPAQDETSSSTKDIKVSSSSEDNKPSSSTEDSVAVSTKRLPLRNRRSKPAVNLTAATRKRSTNDATASPCSPPPVKFKSQELAARTSDESTCATNSDDSFSQSVATDTSRLSSAENTPVPPSSPGVTLLRPSDNVNGVFKTPSVPAPKIKDASNDTTCKGDAIPVSPQKESTNIKRKPSTNALRVATARKNLKNRIDADGTPPRSALTMFDLIFYNPSKNPMKSVGTSSNKSRRRVNSVSSIASVHEDRLNEESVDDIDQADDVQNNPDEEVEETAMPVPQVKVGPDGSLILDEQSLVIETTGAKKNREELEKSEVIVDSRTGYGHYKKIVRSKDWSDHETKKFYRALNVVGTDFSLMKPYFRSRTRRELKLKFKKEERLNSNLINKALAEPLDFDISELEKECELEDEEEKRMEEVAKEKTAEKLREKSENSQDKTKNPSKKKKCAPLEEIGLEAGNSSADENRQKKKRKASASVTSEKKKKSKNAAAEEDYNMLAMGVDIPMRKDSPSQPKREKPTVDEEEEDMGIFAEAKMKLNNTTRKQPSVKRIVERKAPNLPKKPAASSNSSLLPTESASRGSHPQTIVLQNSKDTSLKIPSTTLSTNATAVLSTAQSQSRIMTTSSQTNASTSGSQLIQSSTQPRIHVIHASPQPALPSTVKGVQPLTPNRIQLVKSSVPQVQLVHSTPQSRIQLVQSSSQSPAQLDQSSSPSRVQIIQTSPQSRVQLVQSSPQSRVQLVQSSPQSRVQLVQSSPQSRIQLVQSSPQSRVQLVQSSPQSRVQLVQSSPQSRVQLVQSSQQSRVQLVQSSPQSRVQLIQSSPQSQIQLIQSSPKATPPLTASIGAVTPKTLNIIRKPGTSAKPVSTSEHAPTASPNSALPVSTLLRSFSGGSTCLVSSPGGKFVQSTPPSRIRTVQVTPQSSPSVAGLGPTTPVDRLLPSTPLPRMEPGSIIVLKTPLPQNPDRHVLQVYMVTNTPPGSSGNTTPHTTFPAGINLLSGPSVQPATLKSPIMSDDSDCEKVLTTL